MAHVGTTFLHWVFPRRRAFLRIKRKKTPLVQTTWVPLTQWRVHLGSSGHLEFTSTLHMHLFLPGHCTCILTPSQMLTIPNALPLTSKLHVKLPLFDEVFVTIGSNPLSNPISSLDAWVQSPLETSLAFSILTCKFILHYNWFIQPEGKIFCMICCYNSTLQYPINPLPI